MKLNAKWIKCQGEAHSNPYIDHCGICMPFWGEYPVCPIDKTRLIKKGYCTTCRRHFEVER